MRSAGLFQTLVVFLLLVVGLKMPAAAETTLQSSRAVVSPLRMSVNSADYIDVPQKAVVLRIDQSALSDLWDVQSVLLLDMPMPGGQRLDLDLKRIANPISLTWLLASGPNGQSERALIPSADVVLLGGSIVGQPHRRAFIGLTQSQAQGWIESDDGLHLISTPPGGGPTLMYLVGADRGGIDIPPPAPIGPMSVVEPSITGVARGSVPDFDPVTTADRILAGLADADSPLHRSMSAETVLKLLDFSPRGSDRSQGVIDDIEYGACCLSPGLCFQVAIDECWQYCQSDPDDAMESFCDYDADNPPDYPPCWLGAGVPCDEQWVCYEAAVQGPDDPDDAPWIGNWTGACCYPDPDNPGETLFEDKVACECAILNGRFVAEPAYCLGEYLPAETPLDNFISVADIELILPEGVAYCALPSGACCVEQSVVCASIIEGADDVIQDTFKRIGCLFVPQVMCEDAAIITSTFNGTGGPGLFIKECFPCTYEANTASDSFICAVEVLDVDEGEVPAAPLPPKGVRCQTPKTVIDTDSWYLKLFNGDVGAAQAYATLLMAATTFIYERDALVSLDVGELLLRVNGTIPTDLLDSPPSNQLRTLNPYLPGACCRGNACWEDVSYIKCVTEYSGEWQGAGTSCYDPSGSCTGVPVNIFEPTVWTIADTRDNMVFEWLQGASANLNIQYDMVLLLSGFPYRADANYNEGSQWGVVPAGVATGTGASLCTSTGSPFAVASINGRFPYPGMQFESDDAGWDVVTTSQAIALTIGVLNTWVYGYDSCRGATCDSGVDARSDCDFQNALGDFDYGSMPATLMSHCYRCDGGVANLQLRFRSEIAARIYARLANLDCVASGSTTAGPYPVEIEDPDNPGEYITVLVPLAGNDVFRIYGTQSQSLNVLQNDVPIGCTAVASGVLDITAINGEAGSATTALGGFVEILTDPILGVQELRYTPPLSGLCGMDYFEYTVESPDPDNDDTIGTSTATVKLLRQPVAGDVTIEPVPWIDCMPGACCVASGVCVDMAELTCVNDGGSWQGAGTACGDAGIPCPPAGTVNACLDLVAQATWPQSITEPPFATTPPGLPVDPCRLDMLQVNVINPADLVYTITWDGLVAQIVDDSVTQPQELLMRFWFATVPGGLPAEFVDVRPFADPAISTDCGPLELPPVVGNVVGPSFGQCQFASPRYVPSQDGVSAIPVQLLVDHDEVPGADACWLGGSILTYAGDDAGFGAVESTGACCLGGLCIETNPFDCLALSGFVMTDDYWGGNDDSDNDPDPDDNERIWLRSAVSSGFFMGVGTTCGDADWCRSTAPCCYETTDGFRACEQLTGDDCWLIGIAYGNLDNDYAEVDGWGTIRANGAGFVDATALDGSMWSNSDEPAWGLGCDFPVCLPEPYLATIASCCVRTSDDTFCANLTAEDCDDYATLTGWQTSWSIRGTCDQVPCSEYGGTPWSAPRGACCYQYEGQTATCVDNLTFEECMDTNLTPNDVLDAPNWVSFREGQQCAATDCEMEDPSDDIFGACCMSLDDFCCVEAVTREVCNTLGGGWLGTASTCVSCVPRETPSGVCCLHGLVCTSDLTPIRCSALFGSWHGNFDTCREGLPCVGATLVGTPGACCYEYECVDATTPGLQNITEADCLLGGGRWLGIGLCNGNPADPNVFPLGACDPVDCLNVAGLTTYNVETFDATTCIRFGGEPVILLGDVNGDGRVGGMADLLPLINQWGQPSMDADFDGSGMVDVRDLLILFTHWE